MIDRVVWRKQVFDELVGLKLEYLGLLPLRTVREACSTIINRKYLYEVS